MKELVQEAIQITSELGDVTFIGALAIYMHTKTQRASRDLDFAIALDISDDQLISLGYKIQERNGKRIKYTPRDIKVDIYTNDVSGIPVTEITRSAKICKSGKNEIKVASLEVLIYAKHTAARPQDLDDLKEIARTKFKQIDWAALKYLVNSKFAFDNIKRDMEFYHEI